MAVYDSINYNYFHCIFNNHNTPNTNLNPNPMRISEKGYFNQMFWKHS